MPPRGCGLKDLNLASDVAFSKDEIHITITVYFVHILSTLKLLWECQFNFFYYYSLRVYLIKSPDFANTSYYLWNPICTKFGIVAIGEVYANAVSNWGFNLHFYAQGMVTVQFRAE